MDGMGGWGGYIRIELMWLKLYYLPASRCDSQPWLVRAEQPDLQNLSAQFCSWQSSRWFKEEKKKKTFHN